MKKRLRKKLYKLNFSNDFSLSKIVIEAQFEYQEQCKKYMKTFGESLFNKWLKAEGIEMPEIKPEYRSEWIK